MGWGSPTKPGGPEGSDEHIMAKLTQTAQQLTTTTQNAPKQNCKKVKVDLLAWKANFWLHVLEDSWWIFHLPGKWAMANPTLHDRLEPARNCSSCLGLHFKLPDVSFDFAWFRCFDILSFRFRYCLGEITSGINGITVPFRSGILVFNQMLVFLVWSWKALPRCTLCTLRAVI